MGHQKGILQLQGLTSLTDALEVFAYYQTRQAIIPQRPRFNGIVQTPWEFKYKSIAGLVKRTYTGLQFFDFLRHLEGHCLPGTVLTTAEPIVRAWFWGRPTVSCPS